MSSFVPFIEAKSLTFEAIGSPQAGGVLYLQSLGYTMPAENPVDLQEARKRQMQSLALMDKAAREMAIALGIKTEEAYTKLFNTKVKTAEETESGKVEVIEEDENAGASLSLYLKPEELAELLTLQDDRAATVYRSVTLCIKNRVAYPVKLLRSIPANGATSVIDVAPIAFPLNAGQKIKFGTDFDAPIVEVAAYTHPGKTKVQIQPVSTPVDAPIVGYLITNATEEIKVGDPDWTEANTQGMLGDELIAEVYGFYFRETSGMTLDDAKKQQVRLMLQNPVLNLEPPQSSTGQKSIGGSSGTDVASPNSQTELALSASQSS